MGSSPYDVAAPASPPSLDTGRVAASWCAARRLHPGVGGSPGVNRLAALAARIIAAHSSLVSLVSDVASMAGSAGLPHGMDATAVPVVESLCAMTSRGSRPLVIPDTRADPRSHALEAVVSGQVGAYLGVPMISDSGHVVGAMCVFGPQPRIWSQSDMLTLQELAAAAAAELELAALSRDYAESRARWDLAIEAAGIGNFDWDLRTGQLLWDEALIALFGYDDDDRFGQTIEDFNDRLHPDDLPHVEQALQHAIDTVGDYEAEYRVLLPDGRTRWVQARGRALGREGGVAERLLGAAWDVSTIRGTQDRASQIVAAMPVGYVCLDTGLRVLAVNNIAERMLNKTRTGLVGRSLRRSLPADVGDAITEVCTRVALTVQPENLEIRVPHGGAPWLEASAWPDTAGVAVYLSDITARKRAQEAIELSADHDKSIAIALQDSMLTRLPDGGDVVLEARYLTAAAEDKVGGDWYDALRRPGGVTVVTVGDVVGHDIAAAAVMGQVRGMLRTFAWEHDDPPAAILERLDRAIHDLHPGAMATSVTARVEPPDTSGTRTMRWANAGHPPPIVVGVDGSVEVLEREVDLLLGVDPGTVRQDHTVSLLPGSTVVLYTDGLIETREAGLDEGIDRLTDALRRHHALAAGDMLDAVLADTVADHPGDDVAILAIRPR